MIWLFMISQVILVWISWWVYSAYFTQPRHNHPMIFWNPVTRILLIYGPFIGIVGLVIASFFLTSHFWLFLVFTLVFCGYWGHKNNRTAQGHIIPVLTEKGVELESFSTEELLRDIRRHGEEFSQNGNTPAKEECGSAEEKDFVK